ncbi:MAG: glycoside hydrolase family 16 protein [Treponema sp.]|jgi:beta-glucanase (GH16 family)|nr:glycoside hydrolase family 16 protein [Treponema sp.]
MMKNKRFAKMSGFWSLASVFAVSCASLSCVPSGDGKKNPDSISITQNPVKTDYVETEGWSDDYFSENFDPDRTSFYDKFNGDALDTGKWLYQNGTGSQFGLSGWGNREAQFYKGENVTVRDGVLRIELRKERAGYGADARQYTSGKLVTYESESGAETFSQKYGRFEAKIRLTAALDGLWLAFWMMPTRSVYGGWPNSGEIDIMEIKGRFPNEASATVHFQQFDSRNRPPGTPAGWNGNRFGGYTHWFTNSKTITDWHIYGIKWTPDGITLLTDGKEIATLSRSLWDTPFYRTLNSPDNAPFDQEFHLILNLAVGGNFDGLRLPKDSDLPAAMEIDWIRVYTLEDDPWENQRKFDGRIKWHG